MQEVLWTSRTLRSFWGHAVHQLAIDLHLRLLFVEQNVQKFWHWRSFSWSQDSLKSFRSVYRALTPKLLPIGNWDSFKNYCWYCKALHYWPWEWASSIHVYTVLFIPSRYQDDVALQMVKLRFVNHKPNSVCAKRSSRVSTWPLGFWFDFIRNGERRDHTYSTTLFHRTPVHILSSVMSIP